MLKNCYSFSSSHYKMNKMKAELGQHSGSLITENKPFMWIPSTIKFLTESILYPHKDTECS